MEKVLPLPLPLPHGLSPGHYGAIYRASALRPSAWRFPRRVQPVRRHPCSSPWLVDAARTLTPAVAVFVPAVAAAVFAPAVEGWVR
ncbi:hypothetical protein Scani_55120 [Streptomyces caniferus]|uniref:Uncharacterized protein n=1 Tax=Streptomyces caniferus TaxID=285557 RepID=A0A640SEF9_9ACTN|nr:hypothetical protein Scani_55120 [Streptomyces caniferus]